MSSTFTNLVIVAAFFVARGLAKCVDLDSRCEGWSKAVDVSGDYGCHANPKYMLVNCPNSCYQCRCGNADARCDGWANNKQCGENPNYMGVYCRKACKMCEGNEETVRVKIDLDVLAEQAPSPTTTETAVVE